MNSKNEYPLFSTALMGSLPRSNDNMTSRRKLKRKLLSEQDYWSLIEKETAEVIKWQEALGVDIITSGELYRDNYVSFVSEKLSGVQMMSMSELLEYIEDKKAFEEMLNILDVPASAIKNPVCIGKLRYTNGLAVDELKMVQKYTKKPIKITLPGPYLLTRSMWFPELTRGHYASKEELGADVIKILKVEIDNLTNLGVNVIQLDEPVLTEVVFTEGKTRTFMCAALAEKKDPTEELAFAESLIKPIINYMKKKDVLSSVHVCRGNWSTDETTLLQGPYTPLLPLFHSINPDILGLEFSTPRAGELSSLFSNDMFPKNTILGLGVINPRTEKVEDKSKIISQVNEAKKFLPSERIWLTPDCGFATFANRPVNHYDIIEDKIHEMVDVAKRLRCMDE
ncbi:5-methyltetrahydropteroyltriglutamate-homocysteine methyltransferase [Enterococcus sp. AZ135]|uniref:cobalamin-independent methionine synthase II family protein n=1 Tax=unclassified Enterococcus TaxID=2608891 RepID=UPI003F26F647